MKAFIVRTLLIIVSVLIIIQLWIFSSLVYWRTNPVENTMFMRWTYLSDFKPIQHEWQAYDDISDHFKHAIIAAEDARFIDHHGFDWTGIEDALQKNMKKDKVVAGGSTISQQVAKNVFLWQGRSWLRKGLEVYFTFVIEKVWGKQRILEMYLNTSEMGIGVFGIEAASEYYFNKPAKDLTKNEAARIAAALPLPRKYNVNPPSSFISRRASHIERQMRNIQGSADLEKVLGE